MKIMLLGKDGQLGWELQRSLSPLGELLSLGRQDGDIRNFEKLRSYIRNYFPDVLVNATAYTLVDKAESEAEEAYLINAEAVDVMANECAQLGIWFVHYSTDYVFDGDKPSAYIETDIAEPLNVYGKSKLAGENAICRSGCKYLIFRSSWIYSMRKENFPLKILQHALKDEKINVVCDSFGTPTSVNLVADVTALALYRISTDFDLERTSSGIYHLVASDETSWYEYAEFLVALARKKGLPVKTLPHEILPISGISYQGVAQRPKNSRLDNKKIINQFNLVLPHWGKHVEQFVEDLVKSNFLESQSFID